MSVRRAKNGVSRDTESVPGGSKPYPYNPVRESRFPRTVLPLSALFLWLLLDAETVRAAAADALALCAKSVVPALFPFLAVSRLLMSQGFGEWAAPLFSGLMTPLYRLPGEAGGVLALGLAGGYPVGAGAAADLYRRGQLTRDEAERLLSFCNNASPAYFISILGGGVFGSTRTGLWLYLIHLLSALLTGLLFRGKDRRGEGAPPPAVPAPNAPPHAVPPSVVPPSAVPPSVVPPPNAPPPAVPAPNAPPSAVPPHGQISAPRSRPAPAAVPSTPAPIQPFLPALADAVGGAALAMVRVCAFVAFFSTLAAPLRNLGGAAGLVSAGLLDLFSLTSRLTADRTGFILVSALAAFGGLGVLGQTAAALEDSGLSLRPCVLGKAVQGGLAGCIAAALSGVLL